LGRNPCRAPVVDQRVDIEYEGDDFVVLSCSCCSLSLRMTSENARIAAAAKLRYRLQLLDGQQLAFAFNRVPEDIDLAEPVDAATIRRVVAVCISVAAGR
jgi:hypothetical protein